VDQTQDHRIAQRFPVVYNVVFEQGSSGLTSDMSTSGFYFTTQSAIHIGQSLRFCILLEKVGTLVSRLRCEGQVVRTDNLTQQLGVAVQFSDFGFEYIG